MFRFEWEKTVRSRFAAIHTSEELAAGLVDASGSESASRAPKAGVRFLMSPALLREVGRSVKHLVLQ